jgi:tyrosine-protein kinase Etk/Wzc
MQERDFLNAHTSNEETLDLREVVRTYLYHWKWFLLAVVIALSAAFLYLRYTPKTYNVGATILIDDEKSGGMTTEMSAFQDLGFLGNSGTSIENEIGVLTSRSLMERVVKELELFVSYYQEGRVQTSEIFSEELPFVITFAADQKRLHAQDTLFKVNVLSPRYFELKDKQDQLVATHAFGEKVTTSFGSMTLTPAVAAFEPKEILVKINPLKSTVSALRNDVTVALVGKKGSLLNLNLKCLVKAKGEVVLNNLISQYNADAVADKNRVASNTNIFIEERLAVIEKELSSIDKGVELFKTSNQLTDITSEAALSLEGNADLELTIIDLTTQLKLAAYMQGYLADHPEALIPANTGFQDNNLMVYSNQYNQLLLERNRLLENSSLYNPVIQRLNKQVEELRKNIEEGLTTSISSLQISLEQAQAQEQLFRSRITSVPQQEREFRDIQRQQQIVESLYLYLLQKREENSISLAVAVPNAKILDPAMAEDVPMSPKTQIIYLGSVLLGLLIPFGVIYVGTVLDNKVHESKEVEAVVKAPLLGEIPKASDTNKMVAVEGDRSPISESFRMLRTNIVFMLSKIKERGKIVFITSTLPGEGKTFIAVNTASVLALSGKKVLLVGADIRKPRLEEYLGQKMGKGLTHLLAHDSKEVSELVVSNERFGIDILHSGIVAPNPSELLMNGRFEEVLAYGKTHYDYVIVDTAPVKLVTDTFLLGASADLFLYVIRANYLEKQLLEIPASLCEKKRLPNMSLLLNDLDIERGYGYGYGYGYGEEVHKKPWWKR